MTPVRCAIQGVSPGNHVIDALPASLRQTCAPRARAVRGYRMALVLALMAFCAALGFSSTGPRTSSLIATSVEASSLVVSDARDGDPPHEARHRELHLKKPRLSALQVCSRSTPPMCRPLGFHADDIHVAAADAAGARRFVPSDHAYAPRTDPALDLHPGQAPPHAA